MNGPEEERPRHDGRMNAKPMSLWDDAPEGSGVLTREKLDKAFEAVKNQPPDPCTLGRHVVSATALREGWEYARCGNCLGLVKLK